MRITNALFYNTSVNDYQRNMQELFKTNQQISSGRVIQHSYEDSGVYVDTMRLDYEVQTFEQIKETSSKAQTFANNTDKTLNQITSILDQFKTKLIQAASESNSNTSLDALANDLEALRTNLISVGNTSINGQFLFSGTSLNVKPISEDGSYHGNDEILQALIGSGVQIPYNISGQDLFLGADGDYNRMLSTNVKMFDQSKLHPDVMEDGITEGTEVYLNSENSIRDMVGDNDIDDTNDPDTVFYLSGRRSEGDTFSTSFNLSSSSKVSDLLERIGQEYGNTSTNKVVDVGMNAHGQIEITDLKKGSTLLEMNLFGAVDRNAAAGATGNALVTDVDDLVANPDVDIIQFTKSNFDALGTASTVSSKEDIFDAGTFYVGYPMQNSEGEPVKASTTLDSFMPSDVDHIDVNGTDVPATGTVQDLMDEIENQFGGIARLENGQIIVDSLGSDATLIAEDSGGNPVSGFQIPDGMNQSRRGFDKEGNELLGNISQTIKSNGEYATKDTKLIDVAGVQSFDADTSVTTDDTQLLFNGVDKYGNAFDIQIDLTNTASGATFSLDGGTTNYTIYNADGDPTKADDASYKQLMDIVSLATASVTPQDPIASNTNAAAIATAIGAGTPTQAQLDAATAGATSPQVKSHILDAIGFGIAGDAAKQAESIRLADAAHYGDVMNIAQSNVEVSLDYKGRMEVIDRSSSETSIEISLYDSNVDNFSAGSTGAALNFMANDAVVIDDPNIDFYKDLDGMIDAVRSGQFRMDADNGDPRNIGVQNALRRLDHLSDHVTKEHTKIGSYSNALMQAQERSELLSLNVKEVRSEVIDVDVADAYMRLQQLSNSYQASLSTISRINSMSLLNYM